jgi:hypothetical protein
MPMPIVTIDHVQIAIPVASESRAHAFYSGILGFTEIPNLQRWPNVKASGL